MVRFCQVSSRSHLVSLTRIGVIYLGFPRSLLDAITLRPRSIGLFRKVLFDKYQAIYHSRLLRTSMKFLSVRRRSRNYLCSIGEVFALEDIDVQNVRFEIKNYRTRYCRVRKFENEQRLFSVIQKSRRIECKKILNATLRRVGQRSEAQRAAASYYLQVICMVICRCICGVSLVTYQRFRIVALHKQRADCIVILQL